MQRYTMEQMLSAKRVVLAGKKHTVTNVKQITPETLVYTFLNIGSIMYDTRGYAIGKPAKKRAAFEIDYLILSSDDGESLIY